MLLVPCFVLGAWWSNLYRISDFVLRESPDPSGPSLRSGPGAPPRILRTDGIRGGARAEWRRTYSERHPEGSGSDARDLGKQTGRHFPSRDPSSLRSSG